MVTSISPRPLGWKTHVIPSVSEEKLQKALQNLFISYKACLKAWGGVMSSTHSCKMWQVCVTFLQ
jgi:hypothetical protein